MSPSPVFFGASMIKIGMTVEVMKKRYDDIPVGTIGRVKKIVSGVIIVKFRDGSTAGFTKNDEVKERP